MKNKKLPAVFALALVLLIGGAYVLYNKLGSTVENNVLAVQETTKTAEGEGRPAQERQAGTAEGEGRPAQEGSAGTTEGEGRPAQEGQAGASETAGENEEKPSAPDFTVKDRDGNAVSLSDFVGKPVVLNFWASWCGPCKSEMPDFDEAYAEYGDDIHFVMVNMTDGFQETTETARDFIDRQGYTFPVYFDTEGSAATAYGVYSIPATYFIDADGKPVAQGRGALDRETLQKGIGLIMP